MALALIALALLLDFLTDDVPLPPDARLVPGLAVLTGVLSVAYPAVGALIASRLPTNPIGWIFCGVGLIYAVQRFAVAYADYTLIENFALPWGEYVAWFSTLTEFSADLAPVFLMLLFPDGRFPSRRWRIVAWAAVLGVASVTLGDALYPGPLLRTHAYVDNPFGAMGVIGGGYTTYELFPALSLLGLALLLTSSMAALIAQALATLRGYPP